MVFIEKVFKRIAIVIFGHHDVILVCLVGLQEGTVPDWH